MDFESVLSGVVEYKGWALNNASLLKRKIDSKEKEIKNALFYVPTSFIVYPIVRCCIDSLVNYHSDVTSIVAGTLGMAIGLTGAKVIPAMLQKRELKRELEGVETRTNFLVNEEKKLNEIIDSENNMVDYDCDWIINSKRILALVDLYGKNKESFRRLLKNGSLEDVLYGYGFNASVVNKIIEYINYDISLDEQEVKSIQEEYIPVSKDIRKVKQLIYNLNI